MRKVMNQNQTPLKKGNNLPTTLTTNCLKLSTPCFERRRSGVAEKGVAGSHINFAAAFVNIVAKECSMLSTAITSSPSDRELYFLLLHFKILLNCFIKI